MSASKNRTRTRAKKPPLPVRRPSAPARFLSACASRVRNGCGRLHSAVPTLRLAIQAKLAVGRPHDLYEREADAVAERVVEGRSALPISPPAPPPPSDRPPPSSPTRYSLQSWPPHSGLARSSGVGTSQAAGMPERTDTRRVSLQARTYPVGTHGVCPLPFFETASSLPVRRPGGQDETPFERTAPARLEDAMRQSRSAGEPLEKPIRIEMERHFGADFSAVRVHRGSKAEHLNRALGARAFTHGRHVYFGAGQYQPRGRQGRGLLAHELTHVVQQNPSVRRGSAAPVSTAPPSIQRLPGFITSRLASYARHIPGYTLFTVIIGYDPLAGRRVEPTAENLLGGLMGLVPFGTAIFDKLSELGIVTRAFDFVRGQLRRFDLSLERLERTIEEAWDEMDFVRLDPFDYNLGVLSRHFNRLLSDITDFARSLADQVIEMIKEAAIGVAEPLLAENRAWALIKKILGHDPLRDEPVEATPTEILEDFLILIGKEQHLEQMRERGTVEETANWLATQISTFLSLLGQLTNLIGRAWDAIQPENLPNLMGNLQALATDVGGFLVQVWDFATTVAAQVLQLIKDALLSWLSSFADEIPGFHLLTVILERNPFTGEQVPRTAENLMRGFITLLPGGNAIYERLAETGTIAQAAARIEGAMEQLGISWEFIVGLFTGIWESLSIEDLIDPISAFRRIVDRFGEPISRLFAFVNVVMQEMISIILEMMNFPTQLIGSIISNVVQAIEDIKSDPVGFLMNMLEAVKLGFSRFFDNILEHLVGGLADWLFRSLRDSGVEPPADLTLPSILDFVLQALGLTAENLWAKLAERIGQDNVDRIRGAIDRLEGIWNFVRDVQERGVAAIWEYIESQISNLWDMVLEKAQEWIMERIINRAIQWLLSLLDVTGIMPVVNAFISFFNAVQSAIEYLRDILEIVNDYVSTVAAIARGDIEPGAQRMERGLANAIPVAIGFLANQFGLGRIGDKIAEIIAGLREMISAGIDWLLDQAMRLWGSLRRTLGLGAAEGEEEEEGQEATEQRVPFTAVGEEHHLWVVESQGHPTLMVASNGAQEVEEILQRLNPSNLPEEQQAQVREAIGAIRGGQQQVDEAEDRRTILERLSRHLQTLFRFLVDGEPLDALIEAATRLARRGRQIALGAMGAWRNWMAARRRQRDDDPPGHRIVNIFYENSNFAATGDGYTTFSGSLDPNFLASVFGTSSRPAHATDARILNEQGQEQGRIRELIRVQQTEIPGSLASEHAEAKMMNRRPDEPLGVTQIMCGGCQSKFMNRALQNNNIQVVADSDSDPRVFVPASASRG